MTNTALRRAAKTVVGPRIRTLSADLHVSTETNGMITFLLAHFVTDLAVGRRGKEFGIRLGLRPDGLVRRIAMADRKQRSIYWSRPLADIPESDLTIVLTAGYEVCVFRAVAERTDRKIRT